MKMNTSMKLLRNAAIALTSCTILLQACSKDDDDNDGRAETTIKVTDAAIDDASVTGAFVTITDIKLDGKSVEGFKKTTVDIHAYQNGETKTIGNFKLDSKTYNSITFVLDYEKDAEGNAPGSYVMTSGSVKHKLESNSNEITINKSFTLEGNTNTNLVADFDLRKMITTTGGSSSDKYNFATQAELQNSIRVVTEKNAGIISGKLTDNVSGSAKVVAYAYKKGTFNRITEMTGQGESNIQFKNAVSSSVVNNNGDYQLHFLESGDYEIRFASYRDLFNDGRLDLIGTLTVSPANNIDLLGLSLGTNVTLTANATVTAVAP